MTTVSSLVDSSLRLLKVIGSGESASTDELSDAVDALNMMLDSWSAEPNNIYYMTRESFTLTVGDGEYTIGSTGDLSATRPTRILSAFLRYNNVDYPLKIYSAKDYAKIAQKNINSLPSKLYYEPSYPNGSILFDYLPEKAYSLHLYSQKPLPSYSSSDTISLPPAYERAMKYNLAVEIAPEYAENVPAVVAAIAAGSLSVLKKLNSQPIPIINTNIFAPARRYKIESDSYI